MGCRRLSPFRVLLLAVCVAVVMAAATTSTAATRPRPRRRRTVRLEGSCEGVAKFNLISLGKVRLARTEVLGAVAAAGDVNLSEFSVNSAGAVNPVCDTNGASLPGTPLALVTKGNLVTTNGDIKGPVVSGEQYLDGGGTTTSCAVDEEANVDVGEVDKYVRQETSDNCAAPVAGCETVTAEGGLLRFVIQQPSNGAAAHCAVSAETLTAASRVEVAGRADPSDMVKIAVHGRGNVVEGSSDGGGGGGRAADVTLTNMGFDGFVPSFTLLSMCNVPKLTVQDVGLPSAVFAPDTRFRGSSGHVNGTVVVADVASGVEFQLSPIDCPRRGRRRGRGRE